MYLPTQSSAAPRHVRALFRPGWRKRGLRCEAGSDDSSQSGPRDVPLAAPFGLTLTYGAQLQNRPPAVLFGGFEPPRRSGWLQCLPCAEFSPHCIVNTSLPPEPSSSSFQLHSVYLFRTLKIVHTVTFVPMLRRLLSKQIPGGSTKNRKHNLQKTYKNFTSEQNNNQQNVFNWLQVDLYPNFLVRKRSCL